MEDFKQRLLAFIKTAYGFGQNKFEDYCGLNHGTISSIKKKGPSAEIVEKISNKCPELNLNWLFRGDDGGPMLNEEQHNNENPTHFASPTNDIHNNNVVIIGNWAELGEIVEKAVVKATRKD